MVRVIRGAKPANASQLAKRATRGTLRKHKVILENVTQEKKKLRTVLSFEAAAPPGYTFIPAGNPNLTSACKEMCRKDGLRIFTVTTTPHQRAHNLSQQVHRIGYHFPSVVVDHVCMQLGYYLNATGKAMALESFNSIKADGRAGSEASQTTINTEARDVIRDLFPNIPEKDMNIIISTAFQKGQRKVGTAVGLPLPRRAQLAVVAHIRHLYTDYDKLLKTTTFQEARSIVEPPTLERLVEWRGDDENGKTELEDVFREVIVISDDDDDDDDDQDHRNQEGNPTGSFHRDSSIEIVSHDTMSNELEIKIVDNAKGTTQDILEDELAPLSFRIIPGVYRKDNSTQSRNDRRGFSRYEVWKKAKDLWREKRVAPGQKGKSGAHMQDNPNPLPSQRHQRRTFSITGTSQGPSRVGARSHNLNRYFQVARSGTTVPSAIGRDQFDILRGTEKVSIASIATEPPLSNRSTHIIRPLLVRNMEGPRPNRSFQSQGSFPNPAHYPEMTHRKRHYTQDPLNHSRSYDDINQTIIPSIETSSFTFHDGPVRGYHDPPARELISESQKLSPRRRHEEEFLSRKLEVIDLTGNDSNDNQKRRRLDPSISSFQSDFECWHASKPGYPTVFRAETDRPRDLVTVQEEQNVLRATHHLPNGNKQYNVPRASDAVSDDNFSSLSHISQSQFAMAQDEPRHLYLYQEAVPRPFPENYLTESASKHTFPERVLRSAYHEEPFKKGGKRQMESLDFRGVSPNPSLAPISGPNRPSSSIREGPTFAGIPTPPTRLPLPFLNVVEGSLTEENQSVDLRNTRVHGNGRISQGLQTHGPGSFVGEVSTNPEARHIVVEDLSQHRHSGGYIDSYDKVVRTERALNLPRHSPLVNARNVRLPASAVKRYMSQKGMSQDPSRFAS